VLMLMAALAALPAPAQASHTPFIWPHSGYITTAYHTWRDSCKCYHDAVDISNDNKWGDPIVATYGGKVTCVCTDSAGGKYVVLDHGSGYTSLYLHLQDFTVVHGQQVAQGQLIGHEGSTGYSTGPHLHFAIKRNGVPQAIPGAHWQWVTRGQSIPQHYDIAPPPPPDTTPPATTASLAGTAGSAGWYRSAVTVTLSASDGGGSGVAGTWYRVDGAAWVAYAAPFTIGSQGAHTVQYYSKDKAGNQEATRSAAVRIDTLPPATSHALTGVQGDDGWWRSAVSVRLTATDATSGVASTTATRDGASFAYDAPFAVDGEGQHGVTYASRDVASNVEATKVFALSLDTQAPSTSLSHGSPSWQGSALYVSGTTPFTLAASDATSGVRRSTWTWDGVERTATGPFTLPGADGLRTLTWRSRDVAGNEEAWRSRAVFLDTTAPEVAMKGPAEGSIVASLEPVLLEPEATDAGSGVARVEFLVDGVVRHTATAEPYAWAWPAGDEALGEHVVAVRAVDRLGHATLLERTLTTVPTSPAGLGATALRAQGWAEEPPVLPSAPALPVVGVVAEADPANGEHRVGLTVDGAFLGVEG
jgi:hypothetical protein